MNTEITNHIETIATLIAKHGGNLSAFAYSIDMVDRIGPMAIRERAAELARLCIDLGDDDVRAVKMRLVEACGDDEWALSEVAKRFTSAVVRLRLVRDINRHPRADRFVSLVRALKRGRYSRKQLAFAKRLANEVNRAA